MKRYNQLRSVIATLSAIVVALIFNTPHIASAGELHLLDDNQAVCILPTPGEGETIFGISCNSGASRFFLKDVPSTTQIVLTSADCSTSSSTQQWRVVLQTTARETSTNPLTMANVVSLAEEWSRTGKPEFIAPYVKIISAQIRGVPTHPARVACAQIQMATKVPASVLKLRFQQRRSDANDVVCDTALVERYSRNATFGTGQCVYIEGADGEDYYQQEEETRSFSRNDGPVYCPPNKVVTQLKQDNDIRGISKGSFTCSKLVKKTGEVLKINSSHTANRWIDKGGYWSICENPSRQGADYLVSQPNALMTGYEVRAGATRWYCSTYSAP